MYSRRRAAERIEAIGLALDCPAISGADPWTGSPCLAKRIGREERRKSEEV